MNNGQQFVDDYLMVVENDSRAWQHHQSIVIDGDKHIYDIAETLRDQFESYVSDKLDRLDPSHEDYFINIMREMLLGWGVTPYENIARELVVRVEEGK